MSAGSVETAILRTCWFSLPERDLCWIKKLEPAVNRFTNNSLKNILQKLILTVCFVLFLPNMSVETAQLRLESQKLPVSCVVSTPAIDILSIVLQPYQINYLYTLVLFLCILLVPKFIRIYYIVSMFNIIYIYTIASYSLSKYLFLIFLSKYLYSITIELLCQIHITFCSYVCFTEC